METTTTTSFHAKISYGSEIRRFLFTGSSFDDFVECVKKLFSIPNTETLQITYKDDEGDFVTISSTMELFNSVGSSPKDQPLKIFINRTSQSSFFPSPSPFPSYPSPIIPENQFSRSFSMNHHPHHFHHNPPHHFHHHPPPPHHFHHPPPHHFGKFHHRRSMENRSFFGHPKFQQWQEYKSQYFELKKELHRIKQEGNKEELKKFKEEKFWPMKEQFKLMKWQKKQMKENQGQISPLSVSYELQPRYFLLPNQWIDVSVVVHNNGQNTIPPGGSLHKLSKCKFLTVPDSIPIPGLEPGKSTQIVIRCLTSASWGGHKAKYLLKLADQSKVGGRLVLRIKIPGHNYHGKKGGKPFCGKYSDQVSQLVSMGYPPGKYLGRLLWKHKGDVSAVIEELSGSQFMSQRPPQ